VYYKDLLSPPPSLAYIGYSLCPFPVNDPCAGSSPPPDFSFSEKKRTVSCRSGVGDGALSFSLPGKRSLELIAGHVLIASAFCFLLRFESLQLLHDLFVSPQLAIFPPLQQMVAIRLPHGFDVGCGLRHGIVLPLSSIRSTSASEVSSFLRLG